jgi:hypothetical protein
MIRSQKKLYSRDIAAKFYGKWTTPELDKFKDRRPRKPKAAASGSKSNKRGRARKSADVKK